MSTKHLGEMTGKEFSAILAVATTESRSMDEIEGLHRRREREKSLIANGSWSPECAYCRKAGTPGGFFPPHTASARCQSGKYDHCSCSTCF